MSFLRQCRARAALVAALVEMYEVMREEVGEGVDSVTAHLEIDHSQEDVLGTVSVNDGEMVIMEQSL